jgi:hypothetical protein
VLAAVALGLAEPGLVRTIAVHEQPTQPAAPRLRVRHVDAVLAHAAGELEAGVLHGGL